MGDEGWFALKTIPASWDAAGPTADGLTNYLLAGPGLGTPDAFGDREALLDKIPDVTPLRATGLKQLQGKRVCAVVYDSDISVNYDPLDGSLKGANLGIVAFEVLSVMTLTGFSSSSLPEVEVESLDASEVCDGPLLLFEDAPEPISSSEPFDVEPLISCPCWSRADLLSLPSTEDPAACVWGPVRSDLFETSVICEHSYGVETSDLGLSCITNRFDCPGLPDLGGFQLETTEVEFDICTAQLRQRCAELGLPTDF